MNTMIVGQNKIKCFNYRVAKVPLCWEHRRSGRDFQEQWKRKQVEGNEEYQGVIDDPSSALRIFWGLIFVIREREREMEKWGLERRLSHLSLSLSCGSSKQPWWGQLRGWCMTSQAENGPCPFLPCSISFSSCLSFVMDTACNKKSQHIYGVADPVGTRRLYLPATKQLCYPLRIQNSAQGWKVRGCSPYTCVCVKKNILSLSVFFFFPSRNLDLTLRPPRAFAARFFCPAQPRLWAIS